VSGPFVWNLRVYWEDTDAGGVVYYANYLKFLERCRSEWLRHLGIDQARLASQDRLQFAVVDVHLRYHKPAVYDDLLAVTARVVESRGASIRFEQQIRRGTADGEVLVTAEVRAASIDSVSLRPRPLPAALAGLLAS
jgi:acyl-CoA thioester hydrolase